jgi:hypothetical protein
MLAREYTNVAHTQIFAAALGRRVHDQLIQDEFAGDLLRCVREDAPTIDLAVHDAMTLASMYRETDNQDHRTGGLEQP